MVGRTNSDEAAAVGGNRLLGCYPPADQPIAVTRCIVGGQTPTEVLRIQNRLTFKNRNAFILFEFVQKQFNNF